MTPPKQERLLLSKIIQFHVIRKIRIYIDLEKMTKKNNIPYINLKADVMYLKARGKHADK